MVVQPVAAVQVEGVRLVARLSARVASAVERDHGLPRGSLSGLDRGWGSSATTGAAPQTIPGILIRHEVETKWMVNTDHLQIL